MEGLLWSAPRRGRYIYNTQQTHKTNIYAASGIRTRYLRYKAAADLRLKPHGHRDRMFLSITLPALSELTLYIAQ